MSDDKRVLTIRAEMSPDLYSGPTCDDMGPRWYSFHVDDKDGGHDDYLNLPARHFPPGTVVTVETPECPKCHVSVEVDLHHLRLTGKFKYLCDSGCDFDWDEWIGSKYA